MGPFGSDFCGCNTVMYSLLSACDACQGNPWIPWSEYTSNCTILMPPSTFPNPIPPETHVPQWALIDVTIEGNWNENEAFRVGNDPEQGPGTIIGSKRSLNVRAIVGGVVGGVALISLIIVLGFFLRWRRREAPVAGASQPPMDEIKEPLQMDDRDMASSTEIIGSSSTPGTPAVPVRIYEPDESSRFSGYQGVPQTPAMPPQGDVPSLIGTGNSLSSTQTEQPQGYHDSPTV